MDWPNLMFDEISDDGDAFILAWNTAGQCTAHSILDIGYWILDIGYWILDMGGEMKNNIIDIKPNMDGR